MTQFGNQSKGYLADILKSSINSFKAIGYQQLTLSASPQFLTIPSGARYALMILESTVTTGIVGRYLETRTPAVAIGTGLPIKDGAVFDVTDAQNLAGFQVIQETAGTHKLNIQYYK